MTNRTINSDTSERFSYVGNEMRTIDGNSLDYDLNGNLTSDEAQDTNYDYNWDNKLRSASIGSDSISLKYDPAGNRVRKDSTINGNRKYIVDVVGELPVILLEINPSNGAIAKTYIYANSQILAQHDGDYTASRYYYLHDRLGSVRQILNENGAVVVLYTYNPFGETIEEQGSVSNDFKFTGQYYDEETGQYYLRNRQYIPYIARFASVDPVLGEFERPLTLHSYLYCGNNPLNFIDPDGKWAVILSGSASGMLSSGLVKRTSVLMEQALIGMLINEIDADVGVGGEAGMGIAFGYGEEKGFFFGSVFYTAAGIGITNGSGGALTFNVGISYAQKLEELAGYYTEYGGSVTLPAPVGSIFFGANIGGSLSIGDNGIKTVTVSAGPGSWSWQPGWEGHVYRGKAWVAHW